MFDLFVHVNVSLRQRTCLGCAHDVHAPRHRPSHRAAGEATKDLGRARILHDDANQHVGNQQPQTGLRPHRKFLALFFGWSNRLGPGHQATRRGSRRGRHQRREWSGFTGWLYLWLYMCTWQYVAKVWVRQSSYLSTMKEQCSEDSQAAEHPCKQTLTTRTFDVDHSISRENMQNS